MYEETTGQKVGFWIALVGVLMPSMIVSGFMPDWNVLPLWAWVMISAASAGIGMGIGHRPAIAAFVGGLAGGACIPIALIGYVMVRVLLTETFISVELLIPALIGALPGIGVYKLLAWAFGPSTQPESLQQVNTTDDVGSV